MRGAARRSSARSRSRDRSSRGSPTTASTTPTPTRRGTRTARTSGTTAAGAARSRGLLHAHIGWLFIHTQRGAAEALRARPDRGPGRLLRRPHLPASGRSAGSRWPSLLGYAIGGTLDAALTGPAMGRRRAHAGGPPRDLQHQLAVPLLRPPAFRRPTTSRATCSGWRCSRSARAGTTTITPSRRRPFHGLRRWEIDPSAIVIRGAREGRAWSWDVVRSTRAPGAPRRARGAPEAPRPDAALPGLQIGRTLRRLRALVARPAARTPRARPRRASGSRRRRCRV